MASLRQIADNLRHECYYYTSFLYNVVLVLYKLLAVKFNTYEIGKCRIRPEYSTLARGSIYSCIISRYDYRCQLRYYCISHFYSISCIFVKKTLSTYFTIVILYVSFLCCGSCPCLHML